MMLRVHQEFEGDFEYVGHLIGVGLQIETRLQQTNHWRDPKTGSRDVFGHGAYDLNARGLEPDLLMGLAKCGGKNGFILLVLASTRKCNLPRMTPQVRGSTREQNGGLPAVLNDRHQNRCRP